MISNYEKVSDVVSALRKAQESENDMRDATREAHLFVDDRDGQWEPNIINKMKNRPRYTFDKINPIVDQITGTMNSSVFGLSVEPAGGEATKDTAAIYSGIIRNIRNISNSDKIFADASRNVVTGGIDGWEVTQDFADSDSFDQDLLIKRIPNFWDRVWFDEGSVEPDRSDANWVIVLQDITPEAFKKQFGEDIQPSGIGSDRSITAYYDKPNVITIGRILYKKPYTKTLIQMSDGSVYEETEDFQQVVDDLAAQGITEINRRESESTKVHQRIFDADKWLTDEEETVFTDYLPIVPAYGNFKVNESKVIYRGIVEKLMDAQRVYNYARSREIEEGALSPRAKYWMTKQQAAGHTKQLSTLNTNADPVQFYNHEDGQPAPFQQGGAVINQGLQVTAAAASDDINNSAGLFAANMGANPGLQSGVAIAQQADRGDTGMAKWFGAMELAICHTGKVLVKAIPKVYDSSRQVRTISEDGSSEIVPINSIVFDQATGTTVELNNLAKGFYDVTCEVGDAFKAKQKETAQAFVDIAQIDPSIIEIAKDVWFNNLNVPGMNEVRDRVRQQMVFNGLIPQDQLTDEEQAEIQAIQQQQANQPQQPTPEELIAQAEILKGQAEQQKAMNEQAEIQIKAQQLQLESAKIQQMNDKILLEQQAKTEKLNSETAVNVAKVQQGDRKLSLEEQKALINQQNEAVNQSQSQQQIDFNQFIQLQKQQMEQQQAQFSQMMQAQKAQEEINAQLVNNINTQADTLKKLREAIGVDTAIGPVNTAAYEQQAGKVIEEQNKGG